MVPAGIRKTVTVLFCDVTGSTALGESIDPEALQGLLARYFERMKGIVEFHGGTVEKFIGDAVMAVFGVPAAHEDDALRACRAAVEMQEAFPELGIEGRVGVNTGEVVAGTEERLATGDAVNVAARLEQAAEPGEVLIGEETLALVQEGVVAEMVEPLALKGKAEPVPAFRLLAVPGPPERSHASRFVGRARELQVLLQAWDRALTQSSCELVTVVGDAGVGKSRLVAEALDGIEAPVVRGRCLPYGEGITYWPVVEVVKQLDALPSDEEAAAAVLSLLGESDRPTSADEIAWAFRKLLEEQAPLVVCFDDLQWGEETFLDLVESMGLLSTGAPLLLLCMVRPELLERRPSWPVPLRLEPLARDEADALIGDSLPEDLRRRIADRAGGNPLFITEMLALATDDGEVDVPPTLRALLAARLDQLEPQERSVLERGAVEGELFHRGAVQSLAPDEPEVLPRLAALVRHELIRPERPQFPGEDGFRFRHLLIRDAAYDALPKAVRADLHRRLADWLDERGQELVELDELVGYHLEKAFRYEKELGAPDPEVAERAGRRLAAAGRRALSRGDDRAAASLLERALELTRPTRLDVHLEVDLADVLSRSEPEKAIAIADAATDRARQDGDETAEALARVVAANVRVIWDPGASVDELERLAHAAIPLLEEEADHAGLAYVWYALGFSVANFRLHFEEHAHASEQALHHARLAGQPRNDLFHLDGALAFGPRPADEAIRALEAALGDVRHPHPLLARAYLLALLGRFDEAWEIAGEQTERLRELRGSGHEAWAGWISRLEGDEERAAHYLSVYCDSLEVQGQTGALSFFVADLGRSFCALGRHDEAEPLAQRARELANEQDVSSQALWRRVRALVLVSRGDHSEAVGLAREAVAILEPTDALDEQGAALADLAEVLTAAGHRDEARAALEQALDRYERKKNLVMARQVRERLVELRAEAEPAP